MRAQITAAVIMLLLALLLQGCGRKGPLYLPQLQAPAGQSQPAAKPPVQQIQPAQSAVAPTPTIQNSINTTK